MKFPDDLIAHADYLMTQDETDLALKVLEMVPAYDREHLHPEIEAFKSQILSQILMPSELYLCTGELPKKEAYYLNFLEHTARGWVLKEHLKNANSISVIPHLIDFGPGDYSIPLALHYLGYKFTYESSTFQKQAQEIAHQILGEKTVIIPLSDEKWLIAYEIIEHLADVSEIRQIADRNGTMKKIFLSTPKYTFGDGSPNWKKDPAHHRRAYTPDEFIRTSSRMFPNRKWGFTDNKVMVLVGEKE